MGRRCGKEPPRASLWGQWNVGNKVKAPEENSLAGGLVSWMCPSYGNWLGSGWERVSHGTYKCVSVSLGLLGKSLNPPWKLDANFGQRSFVKEQRDKDLTRNILITYTLFNEFLHVFFQ